MSTFSSFLPPSCFIVSHTACLLSSVFRKEVAMSTAENKTRVRRGFEEGINQKKLDVFDELLAPNYVNHNMPAPAPGPEGFKQVIGMFLTAFPDMHITIEDEFG